MKKALKENFILNDLYGKEDHLVRDGLWKLIGEEIVSFRSETMTAEPAKSMADLIASITPPEGVGLKRILESTPADKGENC